MENEKQKNMISEKICIIIPAYKAGNTIHQVVTGALKHVSKVSRKGSRAETAFSEGY